MIYLEIRETNKTCLEENFTVIIIYILSFWNSTTSIKNILRQSIKIITNV